MVFTHNKSADQFDAFSYGNLSGLETNGQPASFAELNSGDVSSNSNITGIGKENLFVNFEEPKFGNDGLKYASPVRSEDFSFSWLPDSSSQSVTVDNGKRYHSDVKPCQVACKRPRQTDGSTWLSSYEESPFDVAVETSASALADGFVETGEPDRIHANNGFTTCGTSTSIHYPDCEQPTGEEGLSLPDWVSSFPGYFEDCGPDTGDNQVDDIDSPVHEYLPRKGVSIGPDHQADIPDWRPQVCMDVPSSSGSCADLPHASVSTSEFARRDEDSESDKWIRHCVIPLSSCSYPVAGDLKIDCECSDEGSIRCVRQHITEARESLRKSLGQDVFRELGLCEMGEDIAQRWTLEEEELFQRVVFSNPVSSGKNFWDCLAHVLPGKTSKELVSYYFNVFMLRKRAEQNRSERLRVDSDDDESPVELAETEQDGEDSAVESPAHGHYIDNYVFGEDVHEESEEEFREFSFPETIVENDVRTPLAVNLLEDVDVQDESCTSFESQHNGAHGPSGVQCAEFHMMPPNDASNNYGDQGACV